MLIDSVRKQYVCFGIAALLAFMIFPSALAAQIIGPCIQFLDENGAPTHQGLKCDFSADGVTVKFFGGGSVQFSVNGVNMGAVQQNPPTAIEFKATFKTQKIGGTNVATISEFTWIGAGKPQGNAVIPAGATDFLFTSGSGLDPVRFTTTNPNTGKPEKSSTVRPPLTTTQVELFLTKQP